MIRVILAVLFCLSLVPSAPAQSPTAQSPEVKAQAPLKTYRVTRSHDRDCPAPGANRHSSLTAVPFSELPAVTVTTRARAAQASLLVELRDYKIPGRKLLVFSDGSYELFEAPGTRPLEGVATFEKAGVCTIRFTHTGSGPNPHTVKVDADKCRWLGTAKASGVRANGEAFYFELDDRTANQPPRK
jgi:hypothetical protein